MRYAISDRDVWEDEHPEEVPMLDELDDCPYHAPSAFVEVRRCEREERKRREREELQALWREEMRERKREQYARVLGRRDVRGHWVNKRDR